MAQEHDIQVFLDPCTVNSRKVLAGLDYLKTPYKFNHIDYFAGGHKAADYLKINPHATVPSMKDHETILTESNAILQYCAEVGNHAAYPKDVRKRGEVNTWLLWESSAWFPACYTYLVEYVVKPLLNTLPDQEVINSAAPRFHQLAKNLNSQLSKGKWVCGDEITIADFAVAAPMHLYASQQLPLDDYPNIVKWMKEGMEKIPAWQNTQGAVNKALLPNQSSNGTSATNGTSASNGTSQGDEVHTEVNYSNQLPDKLTELYFYETDAAKDVHEPGDDRKPIVIKDGWHKAKEFHADKHGFSVHDFNTNYEEWEDDARVRKEFYPDVVEFVKKQTGCKRVLVFDHTIRTAKNSQKKLTDQSNNTQRSPVMLVHCDYTAESGPLRVRQLLPDEADDLLSRRVSFINVWKPLYNPVEERPLAMADVHSTPDSDFFKLHLRYPDRNGENYVMKYSPNHQWWYFKGMRPNQAIILKTYESETDGRARFVGHTAFEDPKTPKDARMRESVEIRTIVFY